MVDRAAVAAVWKARGFGCNLWSDPAGQVWRDFVHPTDELLMLLEGDLEVEMEGSTLRPCPGQEIVIPAGMVHTVRNVGSGRSRWLFGYRQGE
jgi:mannose-6-phosphate isomerase-like protein (cupin superfamily)